MKNSRGTIWERVSDNMRELVTPIHPLRRVHVKKFLTLAAAAFVVFACDSTRTNEPLINVPENTAPTELPEGIHPLNAAALASPSASFSASPHDAAGLGISASHAGGPAGAIIGNGVIQLGVRHTGDLNVPGGSRSMGGTSTVGLRYAPTGAESTAPGCTCEGWGVWDRSAGSGTGRKGWANSAFGYGNIVVESFTSTASEATAVTRMGAGTGTFRVTHHYAPSAETPNLYQVNVTIENISATPADLIYRRVMDWDIEPTPFREFVTLQRGTSTDLWRTDNNGFNSGDPSSFGSFGQFNVNFVDNGPRDHGALFDFAFGTLAPGAKKSFKTFYGAAGNEVDAKKALGFVGAEVYSFGQPSSPNGAALGVPNTFIFAFGAVGGTPVEPPPPEANKPPVANAGADQTLDRTSASGVTVSLDGSASSDPDGNIVEYKWTEGPNTLGTTATLSVNLALGSHNITLTVKDNKGATHSDDVVITVNNVAPVAVAGPDQTQYRTSAAGVAITLDGTGSSDVDGSVVEWNWLENNVVIANGANPTHVFGLGTHTVTLRVKDNDGTQHFDNVTITVLNVPPVARAGSDQTLECVSGGAVAHLNGSASSDLDGTIASYLWSFGATTAIASNLFGLGSTNVGLTVTDNDGATHSDNVQINVKDTQKPTISMSVTTALWPPNHKMVKVASGISSSDACYPSSSLSFGVTVSSNEVVNGLGDGNTSPDWQVIRNGDGTFDVWVRAERSGNGTGRIYTITATSTDGSGNTATETRTVTVAHSQGK